MSRCKFAPQYELMTTHRLDAENVVHTCYGLKCTRLDFFGGPVRVKCFENLAEEEWLVADLVELFNLYCLPTDYVEAAVADLFNEPSPHSA